MHNMNISIQEIENGVVLNINHDGMYPGKSTFYGSFPALLQNLMRQVHDSWMKMEEDAKKYSQPAGNESILSRAYSQQQANTVMYDQYNALSENERRIRERIQAGELELAAEQEVVEEQYDSGKCPVQEDMKDKTVQTWKDKMHPAKHVGPEDFDNERGGEG